MSFGMAELTAKLMLDKFGPDSIAGDYCAWSYFETLTDSSNRRFIESFRKRFGADASVNDPMESVYVGVHMWAQAAETARSTKLADMRESLGDQTYDAPEGLIHVDAQTLHTWRKLRIGKINASGVFDVEWDSGYLVMPDPYPAPRTKKDWQKLVQSLYEGWGRRWSAQTKS